MPKIEAYLVSVFIILILILVVDALWTYAFYIVTRERNFELRRANDINVYQFEQKKLSIPDNTWDNQRAPTKKEILDMAEKLSEKRK